MTIETFSLHRGNTPLLISMPHTGTQIPPDIALVLVPRALDCEDTDWHLSELYGFARAMGASLITPVFSRYVIDLNRPPQDGPMYAGANNTELCPTRFFSGDALYRQGGLPTPADIAQRRTIYWEPYHAALREELARIESAHGHAVLFDAHSIRPVLPWLFSGRLNDLNLGTADGRSCAAPLCAALMQVLQAQTDFSHVLNGRFKGGHITRHYGEPALGRHAVQLEMAWTCYMDEKPPYRIAPDRARQVLPVLRRLVQTLIDWRPQ